ncbi:MAG: RnfABCDGE type electron transport complex subunit C [bacterium]
MKKALYIKHSGAERLAETPVRDVPLPKRLIVPAKQHAGAPCEIAVEPGAEVKKFQLLARATEPAAADILSPAAGKIGAILQKHPTAFGGYAPAVVIETCEGEQVEREKEEDFLYCGPGRTWELITSAGITMPPPDVRPLRAVLDPAGNCKTYNRLLVLAYDPEPMVATNRRIMFGDPESVARGVGIVRRLLGDPHTTVVVDPADYRADVRRLTGYSEIDVVDTAPPLYPDNLPEMVIKQLYREEVPAGGSPADIGLAVINAETALAALNAVRDGVPFTTKHVTVTGDGVTWPCIVRAPIGATLSDLMEACGGLKAGVEYLVMGGPMRGYANYDRSVAVTRETDAVLALRKRPGPPVTDTPCINCGDCVKACPVRLQPNLLSRYCEFKLFNNAKQQHLYACIECGMCGYVCPSRRPMLQYFRTAKVELELCAIAEAKALAEKEAIKKAEAEADTTGDSETKEEEKSAT